MPLPAETPESLRVLFVDDDTAVRDYHADLLRRAGFSTFAAAGGLEAIGLLEAVPVDVVVLDLYMPGLDGAEVARRLRADRRFAELPVIFLSTEADAERQMCAIAAGGDDFLTKPVRSDLLAAAVRARGARWRRHRILADEGRWQEARLRRSAAMLREAQRIAAIGSWEHEIASGRLDWSDEMFRILEVDLERVGAAAEAFLAAIHPDDRAAVDAAHRGSLASGRPYQIAHRLLMPDGRVKYVHQRCETDLAADGRPLVSRGTVQDVTARTLAERELHLKNQAMDASHAAIAMAGADGRLSYVNRAFLELLRLDHAGQALGRCPTDFLTRPGHLQDAKEVLLADGRWHGEMGARRADGSQVDVHVSASVMRDPEGRLEWIIGSCVDISALRQAQEALRVEHDFVASLLDTAPVIVLLLDPEGRIRHVNAHFEQLTGYARDEVLGLDWMARFVPEYEQARIRALFATALGERPTAGNVNAILLRDGSERQIEWYDRTMRDPAGAATGLLAIGLDVTDRRQAERALRDQERRLRTVLDAEPEGVMIFAADGALVEVNPAGLAMLGAPGLDALRGRAFVQMVAPECRAAVGRMHDRVRAGGRERLEFELSDLLGRRRFVESHATPIDLGDGRASVLAVIRDVSERVEHERALRELNEALEDRVRERTAALNAAKDEAERASAAKTEFLSRMSHELRTPLNSILGYAQLLEADEALSAFQREEVEQIGKAGWHLLELINDLLDFARIESGRLEVARETVAVDAVVAAALATIRPLATARGIAVECAQCRRSVAADRLRLVQVLLNLLSNAVKYNREGGWIRVGCEVAGERLRVAVADGGIGIREADLGLLFQPFSRLYLDTYAIEGSGIGLALSRQLVEAMGGRLEVDSVHGEGSVFTLELPLADGAAAEPPGASATPAAVAGKARLLLIEDSPIHVRLVGDILARHAGIDLLSAESPERGLELAFAHRPDLVLLDINLPGMSGFEVLKRLRADARTRHIPALALSANALPQEVARGRDAGFADYLTKPIRIAEFERAVANALGARQAPVP